MKRKKYKREDNAMETRKLRNLNLNIINNKPSVIIPSQKALEDVEPIKWSDEVLDGKKKVIVDRDYNKNK